MKAILFGTTGIVGRGVLRECLYVTTTRFVAKKVDGFALC